MRRVGAPSENFGAWQQRVAIEAMRVVTQRSPASDEEHQAPGKRRLAELVAERKQLRPDNGAPDLLEIYFEP